VARGGTAATREDEKVRQRVHLHDYGTASSGERCGMAGELLAARRG
jgi:hypothetical protein